MSFKSLKTSLMLRCFKKGVKYSTSLVHSMEKFGTVTKSGSFVYGAGIFLRQLVIDFS